MPSSIKRTAGIVAIVILIAAGTILSRNSESGQNRDFQIKIGVIAPLTGPGARLGEWMMQGVKLAEQEINASGEVTVELIIEDDQSKGDQAVSAYRKLRDTDHVSFIVGPLLGASSVPVSKIAEQDKTILMPTGLASTNMLNAGEYTFTVLPSMASVANAITQYAAENGWEKLSLVYSDDEYGNENEKAVRTTIESLGGTLVTAEKYSRGTRDLRTQLAKMITDESQAIVMAGYIPDYAIWLKQAKELGITKQLLAMSNLQAPDAISAQKESGQVVYYSYPSFSKAESVISFSEKYRSQYPDASGFLPMYIGSGYDALKILVNAISKCEKDDIDCVKEKLLSLRHYQGANGAISFDSEGNNQETASLEIRVLKEGEFSRIGK